MTDQQVLTFENSEPLAATADPITSHEAAEAITESGARDSQKAEVLDAVRRWPGLTSAELAGRMKRDRYVVARRLPDLKQDGYVIQGEPRKCLVSGRNAVTWVVQK